MLSIHVTLIQMLQISNKQTAVPPPLEIKLQMEVNHLLPMITHTTKFFLLKATFIFYKMDSAIHFQVAFFILSERCYKKKSVSTFCVTKQLLILLVKDTQLRAASHLQLGGIPGDTATLLHSD